MSPALSQVKPGLLDRAEQHDWTEVSTCAFVDGSNKSHFQCWFWNFLVNWPKMRPSDYVHLKSNYFKYFSPNTGGCIQRQCGVEESIHWKTNSRMCFINEFKQTHTHSESHIKTARYFAISLHLSWISSTTTTTATWLTLGPSYLQTHSHLLAQ